MVHHARACRGHPRLCGFRAREEDVDDRDKPGHDDVDGPKPLQTPTFPAGATRAGVRQHHAATITYSKSPGLLSIPTLGGAIQLANVPGSLTGFISSVMKSPSALDGSH